MRWEYQWKYSQRRQSCPTCVHGLWRVFRLRKTQHGPHESRQICIALERVYVCEREREYVPVRLLPSLKRYKRRRRRLFGSSAAGVLLCTFLLIFLYFYLFNGKNNKKNRCRWAATCIRQQNSVFGRTCCRQITLFVNIISYLCTRT